MKIIFKPDVWVIPFERDPLSLKVGFVNEAEGQLEFSCEKRDTSKVEIKIKGVAKWSN